MISIEPNARSVWKLTQAHKCCHSVISKRSHAARSSVVRTDRTWRCCAVEAVPFSFPRPLTISKFQNETERSSNCIRPPSKLEHLSQVDLHCDRVRESNSNHHCICVREFDGNSDQPLHGTLQLRSHSPLNSCSQTQLQSQLYLKMQ